MTDNKKLVEENLKLVYNLAHQYNFKCKIPVNDLIQVGVKGMIRATETWDPNRMKKFGTYAWIWVRKYMSDFVRSENRYKSTFNIHLDAQLNNSDGEGCDGYNLVQHIEEPMIEDLSHIEEDDKKFLHRIIEEILDETEKYIIRCRFFADKKISLNDLSKKMGMKTQNIRAIEKSAKDKIKVMFEVLDKRG